MDTLGMGSLAHTPPVAAVTESYLVTMKDPQDLLREFGVSND